ncbi:ERV/ALR sulfhydryl oxidase domain-containing protein [Achaetomium macrosporum]|uniref:Sulfhydryl oxidase n=1 Tax=Achaetomium macrosporum TaxID=79813 RepID=A0AAN7H9D9_9PEZI|nr:ERV/ALR sulfhydryl oxidase domain-containing protein [Achaetomium macrosporum]
MARRQHLTLTLMAVMLFVGLIYVISGSPSAEHYPTRIPSGFESKPEDRSHAGSASGSDRGSDSVSVSNPASGISDTILSGGSIAPKLENATIKAELGRASWKLFHTMMARFPENPTPDDSLALKTYIQLFARLYPCGDCASHFQKLLKKYPPQTSSRNAAAGWACFVHNEVNKRLKKEQFDCNKIGDFYDCGCGDEEGKKVDELKERNGVTLEKEEGLTRGG